MAKTFRVSATLLMVCASSQLAAQQTAVRSYRAANEHRILGEFVELLAIPNVASDSAGIARTLRTSWR